MAISYVSISKIIISSNPLCKIYIINSMSEKKMIIATGVMLSLLILPSVSDSIAFAQYMPTQGQTGLDDYLKLSKERVRIATENPGTGSGTPMFAVDGALGAIILSTGVFGGIATAFFVTGRKGKYAAMGRG